MVFVTALASTPSVIRTSAQLPEAWFQVHLWVVILMVVLEGRVVLVKIIVLEERIVNCDGVGGSC